MTFLSKVNTMNQIKEKLYLCSGLLAGFCILLITLLLLAQIVGRLFGFIVPSAEDFAGYALAASTFLGLAYTFREGGHIRVTLVIQRFSPVSRKWQEGVILGLSLALISYLSYSCATWYTSLMSTMKSLTATFQCHYGFPKSPLLWVLSL